MAAAGAEVVALVVDSQERNQAFRKRWKLPFPVLSDPEGTQVLQPLDLWNAEERGGIAVPALLAISGQGQELFRCLSRDFADRVNDEDVLERLEGMALAPIEVPSTLPIDESVPAESSEALKGAFPEAAYTPLMNGNYYGAVALSRRVTHEESLAEIKAHMKMSKSFVDAWTQRRKS